MQEDWSYDKAGNAVLTQVNNQSQKGSFNNLNQLTNLSTGDRLKVRGMTSEPADVYVNHQVATMTDATHFEHEIPVVQGSNTIRVEAQDGSGNRKTQKYQVSVTSPPAKVFSYDLNGNMTSDGTRTYAWDAANRLVKVTQASDIFEFSYNGLSQRVQIKEFRNQSASGGLEIRNFIWAGGNQPAQERDASNVVTRSYYAQGEMQGATKLFYTKDHLQSVREVTDDARIVRARYAYDGWGIRTKLSGDLDTVVSFTGHHWHEATESLLMLHRIYRPDLKMFISMDPIGIAGGINTYSYVLNDPINLWDPDGKAPITGGRKFTIKENPKGSNGWKNLWKEKLNSDTDDKAKKDGKIDSEKSDIETPLSTKDMEIQEAYKNLLDGTSNEQGGTNHDCITICLFLSQISISPQITFLHCLKSCEDAYDCRKNKKE